MSAVMFVWGLGCIGWFVALVVIGAKPWEMVVTAVSAAVSLLVSVYARGL